MAATCCANFAKVILIIYNICFLLTGFLLIGLGIWVLADPRISNPIQLTQSIGQAPYLRNAAILLITMGGLVTIVTIIGIVGACLENTILLGIYLAFMFIVCFGEIAGGVVAIVFKDQLLISLGQALDASLQHVNNITNGKYYSSNTCVTDSDTLTWDFVQTYLGCCGSNNSQDYTTLNFNMNQCNFSRFYPNIPISCCSNNGSVYTNPPQASNFNCSLPDSYATVGCYKGIVQLIQKYSPVLIGIGIGFGMLELFGVIFAVCLCQNPGKDF